MAVRALIVYESMFGNTERIAWAVRDGLREYVETETVPVNRAPDAYPTASGWWWSGDRRTRSR
ncbi:hypothetical protein PWY87_25465 [Kribbella solani]|uniref:hypothetical protein n=1 Tax=Kribbella solani TaxID=236067 RepID=UPI0029BA5DAE|nr:hypothetical protein [Kribbella solani]MDX3005051.1 hypothetical protein [Kribbella solani]